MTPSVLPGEVPLAYTAVPGAGTPVLLVHGFGSDFELNWERTGWVRALAGRPLIGCDLRGHGRSGKPHDPAAYTPEAMAGDLVRLLDAVGAERADVVGYSMGARLAWELALAHPGRVRRAVLGGFGPADAFAGADLDRLGADANSPFGRVFRAGAALPGADTAALEACARGQAAHPFRPDPAPRGVPLLFAAGDRDDLAAGAPVLAARTGGTLARVPGRDHRTAVAAQAMKRAAAQFLAAGPEPADEGTGGASGAGEGAARTA
ncbi:alpha/beta fold hydrolase [Streptomonospora nanhaiensis]|uniref:Pimeloyl-ACP methyl ester carboxylesterase n=3 Tax=Streptomonospora nanhaiensis TaxID=1323731 RepID=A0A853BLC2_9ACTN|nr:alpha/beta fold hydrolase [Streptomonospora nanhaiensis]MBV2365617.1 alpha/beta hydrolase [Streptomonospora nanhaiensis]NYI95515.1 pimeloyl-ACP methyl ester carboxylesterase [Streptomonospora nanhaiensis]